MITGKCNHEGNLKLINVNIIFNGDDSSGDDSLMDLLDQESNPNQENIPSTFASSYESPTVAESTEKSAGQGYQSISKRW